MKSLAIFALLLTSFLGFSQDVSKFKLNPEKVSMYEVYLAARHGGGEVFEKWKANNKMQYTKEMWYFSESFYIKKNAFADGIMLEPSIIDISRFELERKLNEEAVIQIPGVRDAVVLLPEKDLLHKFVPQQ